MAKSHAQRQKDYRDRQKEKAKQATILLISPELLKKLSGDPQNLIKEHEELKALRKKQYEEQLRKKGGKTLYIGPVLLRSLGGNPQILIKTYKDFENKVIQMTAKLKEEMKKEYELKLEDEHTEWEHSHRDPTLSEAHIDNRKTIRKLQEQVTDLEDKIKRNNERIEGLTNSVMNSRREADRHYDFLGSLWSELHDNNADLAREITKELERYATEMRDKRFCAQMQANTVYPEYKGIDDELPKSFKPRYQPKPGRK